MLQWLSKKMKKRKGFTLVELVVVIAILGILAGSAVPRLSKSRLSAQIGAHNANVRTLESVAVMWIADNPEKELEADDSEDALKEYLQEWPEVAKALEGQKYGENNTEIKADEKYKVEIDDKGAITVTPGKIDLGAEE